MSIKRQDIKDIINQELGNNPDEEFVPSDSPRFLESKAKISEEEMAIDELLASVPKSQGYYLKLSKETAVNTFEFKLKIENWESWSDLEYEISNIVRSYTAKNPTKWGSGHYRVIVWRDGGIRGPKHKPLDFYIDAMEVDVPNNQFAGKAQDVQEQLSSLSNLLSVVKQIQPEQQNLSPVDVQKMVSDAFLQGQNISSSKAQSEGSVMASIMTGMFTMMTELMKSRNPVESVPQQSPTDLLAKLSEVMSNLGLSPKDKDKPKSLVENIQELKILGLWKEPKDEDPISKIAEMKNLLSIVSDITGVTKGERPSTMEKIVDVIGPHVPEMVGKLTGTIDNVVNYSKMRMTGGQPIQPVRQVVTSNPKQLQPTSEDPNAMFYSKLFTELHQVISANDTSKFPYIREQIVKLLGEQAINDIIAMQLKPEAIVSALTTYGGGKFRDQAFIPQLNSFINQFCNWVITSHQQPIDDSNSYIVACNKCGTEFEYPSKEAFDNEQNKVCGLTLQDSTICNGIIVGSVQIQPAPINEPEIDMNPYSEGDLDKVGLLQ